MAKKSVGKRATSNRSAAGNSKGDNGSTRRVRDLGKIRTDLPPNPTVRLIFHGLMELCRKRDGSFEIGFVNSAQDHTFVILLWDRSSCKLVQGLSDIDPSTVMKLSVKGAAISGLSLYQKEPFHRDAGKDDPRDFRWSLDLESPLFYGYKLPRKKGAKLRPRLRLNNGVFHTAYRTNSEFIVVQGTDTRQVGCLGEYVGANIYLNGGGYVSLKIGGIEWRLHEDEGRTYQIDFLNECPPKPIFLPGPDNDFSEYLQTFELPPGVSPCQLKVINAKDPTKPDFCTIDEIPFSSDKSPCTMAILGQSDNLDT